MRGAPPRGVWWFTTGRRRIAAESSPFHGGAGFSAPLGRGRCGSLPQESAILAARIFRRDAAGTFQPPIFFFKENGPLTVQKKLFLFGVEPGGPLVALRLRFARGRSVGGRGSTVFYGRPLRLKPAPVAARPAWGASSETDAPSTANLRQQGVDKSLLVFACPLVAAI